MPKNFFRQNKQKPKPTPKDDYTILDEKIPKWKSRAIGLAVLTTAAFAADLSADAERKPVKPIFQQQTTTTIAPQKIRLHNKNSFLRLTAQNLPKMELPFASDSYAYAIRKQLHANAAKYLIPEEKIPDEYLSHYTEQIIPNANDPSTEEATKNLAARKFIEEHAFHIKHFQKNPYYFASFDSHFQKMFSGYDHKIPSVQAAQAYPKVGKQMRVLALISAMQAFGKKTPPTQINAIIAKKSNASKHSEFDALIHELELEKMLPKED